MHLENISLTLKFVSTNIGDPLSNSNNQTAVLFRYQKPPFSMNEQLSNILLKDAIRKRRRTGSKGIQRAQTIGRIITNNKVYAELAPQETNTCIFIFLARYLISISLSSDFDYIFILKI